MNERVSLLTDAERCRVNEPVRLNIGKYHTWNPVRPCEFVIDLDARPLAQLADDAVKSKICCKFSSIQSMTNGFLAREGNNVVALSGGDSGSHPFGVFTHIQVSPFLPNFVFLGQ